MRLEKIEKHGDLKFSGDFKLSMITTKGDDKTRVIVEVEGMCLPADYDTELLWRRIVAAVEMHVREA